MPKKKTEKCVECGEEATRSIYDVVESFHGHRHLLREKVWLCDECEREPRVTHVSWEAYKKM